MLGRPASSRRAPVDAKGQREDAVLPCLVAMSRSGAFLRVMVPARLGAPTQ